MYATHPWLLLAALSTLLLIGCIAIPRLRRYALQVFVIPIAFGVCAPLGGAIVLIGIHELGLRVPSATWSTYTIYFLCGLSGALLASLTLKTISRRFGF